MNAGSVSVEAPSWGSQCCCLSGARPGSRRVQGPRLTQLSRQSTPGTPLPELVSQPQPGVEAGAAGPNATPPSTLRRPHASADVVAEVVDTSAPVLPSGAPRRPAVHRLPQQHLGSGAGGADHSGTAAGAGGAHLRAAVQSSDGMPLVSHRVRLTSDSVADGPTGLLTAGPSGEVAPGEVAVSDPAW